ncbi:MAG: outer membrane protein assembly factor BamE [Burkholderiales bacterium]|nr:outer membrane protein assembly factor BamE [Burkholderiales bacterium]
MPHPRPLPFLPRAPLLGGCALALLLAGCAASRQSEDGFLSRITPYRIEIVQGNVVTSEQLARVRPGLSRAQVRDVLGTPLLTDPFHGDRWDYIFTLRRDGTPPQRRSVIVHFQGDSLASIEAPPDLPSEREFVQGLSASRKTPQAPVLELTQAQIDALPAPPRREEPAAAEAAAPLRSYPPVGN